MPSVKTLFQARVKDQGDRPTCVAFAVSALHEHWREIVTDSKADMDLDLSEEFLFYGCKRRDGLPPGMDGTTVSAAKDWLNSDGQCTEDLHPYRATSSLVVAPNAAAVADAVTRKLKSIRRQPTTLEAVAKLVGRGLPLVAVIEIFQNAYTPGAGGMLSLPTAGEQSLGLHAVLIVEVEKETSGQTTVFLNSWGSGWGETGFGRFSHEYFAKYCEQLWSI